MNSNIRPKIRIRLVPSEKSGCTGCHYESLPMLAGICKGRREHCGGVRNMIFKEVKPNGN